MQILGNAVLIKPDKLPERSESGKLIIPETSHEMLPEWGEVVGIGSECEITKIGERVIFPRKSASVIVIDGKDHYLTNEHRLSYVQERQATYSLNCDKCGGVFQSNVAFPEPHICPTCYF